jgi:hypothetical protein
LKRDLGFLDKELGFVTESGPDRLQHVLERFADTARTAVADLSAQVRTAQNSSVELLFLALIL